MLNYKISSWILLFSMLFLQFSNATSQEIANRVKERIKYLSSDELQGRASGSEGNRKAAEYIANFFKENKIQALGTSYFQEFNVVADMKLGAKNSAMFNVLIVPQGMSKEQGRNVKSSWKPGIDYMVAGFSQDTTISGNIAFAGYGISAKDADYDDYAGINAKGKIVVVLRGTPSRQNVNQKFKEQSKDQLSDIHNKFAAFSSDRYKATNARDHGALGIIYLNPQGDSSEILPPLRAERSSKHSGIAAIYAKRTLLSKLFPIEPSIFKNEEKILATMKPHSFESETVSMTLTSQLEGIEKPSANVIGWVAGTNPALANEYLIVGAHFDHLGMGDENSLNANKAPQIHPGADDNGSGTSGMMELASMISQNPLPRPVIFMGFTGEEWGLLGSKYYTNHPTIPLEKIVFMMNLDMIGRMEDHKLSVQGTGSASRWNSLLDSLGKLYDLKISQTADGFGPSDHSSFYGKNIPVLFLFTALHKDYHRSTDTYEKINAAGEETVVKFGESILRVVGNEPKPEFTKVKSAEVKKSNGFRVYVGTIPDYSDNDKGMRITGVSDGSPAEIAGLKEGDIIIKFGDKEIKNVYDYTYALGEYKPGDVVKITVLRGAKEDQKVELPVTLRSRD